MGGDASIRPTDRYEHEHHNQTPCSGGARHLIGRMHTSPDAPSTSHAHYPTKFSDTTLACSPNV
eukprot:scaffold3701_cov192-Alexandrium_tamarense.AAC.5